MLGERPSECCVGSNFLFCFVLFIYYYYYYYYYCNGCLLCVTAFACVVIYSAAKFCNRGSLNRTLHVPTFIISLT
jgi:hypothetical protein